MKCVKSLCKNYKYTNRESTENGFGRCVLNLQEADFQQNPVTYTNDYCLLFKNKTIFPIQKKAATASTIKSKKGI